MSTCVLETDTQASTSPDKTFQLTFNTQFNYIYLLYIIFIKLYIQYITFNILYIYILYG